MSVRDEILFDFAVNIPRLMVGGNLCIVDNVKRIVVFDICQIIVHNGKRYTAIEGKNLIVNELKEERMIIAGEVEQIRFFDTL